ncbi:MAG: glycosyltransferase family 2 protein [Thermaerobacter sp.]|nr:glycosyltransferase family 2 protein [Thermaerobacter sp.]
MARLVAMLPVRNEAQRWLGRVLDQLTAFSDAVVVYDDASDDETSRICRSYPAVRYYRGDFAWFERNEAELRHHLWKLTALQRPDWVLALDADECFEDRALAELPRLLEQHDYDAVAFRIFDFWKSTELIRIDGAWHPWNRFSPLLVRFDPDLPSGWLQQPIHCGRFPLAYRDRVTFYSPLRVRHYGWARGDEHLRKYLFYRHHDLTTYGKVQPHTESVLASTVTLEPWIELPSPGWLRQNTGV